MSNSKMKTVKTNKIDATEHYKKRKKKVDPEERKNEFDNGNDGILPGVFQSIAKSMKMLLILSMAIISVAGCNFLEFLDLVWIILKT